MSLDERSVPHPARATLATRAPRWLVVLAVAVGVLVCGIVASRPADPPTDAPLSGDVAAAAHAIDELTAPSSDHDVLTDLPPDFHAVTGESPVTVRQPSGLLRTIHPGGGCSAPWGDDNTKWDYSVGCKAHDLGYDLLRYAEKKGQPLGAEERRKLDDRLKADMHGQCVLNPLDSPRTCQLVATLYSAGLDFNSWRQRWGPPDSEPVAPDVVGLAVIVCLLVARLPGRRRRPEPAVRAAIVAPDADRYLSFLRVISLATVVLGETLVTVLQWTGVPATALWPCTLVLQLIPVFYLAGGQANLASWRAVRAEGGGVGQFLTGRISWLLRPMLAFVLAWLVVPLPLELLGMPGDSVEAIGRLIAQPLWFLGIYLVTIPVTPVMAWLHERARLLVPVSLALVVVALDLARTYLSWGDAGTLNVLVAALLMQQCGFLYGDGVFARVPRKALAAVALGALAALAGLTAFGRFPATVLGVPDSPGPDIGTPTITLLALAVAQVCVVVLLRAPAAQWLARHRPWSLVRLARTAPITLYLVYLSAVLITVLVAGVLDSGPVSWVTSPRWLVAVLFALTPLLLAFRRFEWLGRLTTWPGHGVESRVGQLAAVLGVLYGALGMLGFVVTGFVGGPGTYTLLGLTVDPMQNLIHLLLGWYLVHTARTELPSARLPWLLTALACVAPMLADEADGRGLVLHGGTIAVALLVAITRRRAPVAAQEPAA